jgi:hypothetical protein
MEKEQKSIIFIELVGDSKSYVEEAQTDITMQKIITCGNCGEQFEKYSNFRFHHNQTHNSKAMWMRRELKNFDR